MSGRRGVLTVSALATGRVRVLQTGKEEKGQ